LELGVLRLIVDEIGCVVKEVEDVGLFEDEIEQKGKMIINRIVFQLDTIIFFVPLLFYRNELTPRF